MTERDFILHEDFDERIKSLYNTAFPDDERIPWNYILRLSEELSLETTAYYDGDDFVGFTIFYPRDGVGWWWYFAVEENLRGKGYGQEILDRFRQCHADRPFILDIESPRQKSDNIAQRQRRYDFYVRNGLRDTGVGRSFYGVEYAILISDETPFSRKDYDKIIAEARRNWPPDEIDN